MSHLELVRAACARLSIVLEGAVETAVMLAAEQAFARAPYPVDGTAALATVRVYEPHGPSASGGALDLAAALKRERTEVWPDCSRFLIGPLVGLAMSLGINIERDIRRKATNAYTLIGYAIRQQQPVH